MAVLQAAKLGLKNFSLLVSHVLVPPAIRDLLGSPKNHVEGFIAPGHVCTLWAARNIRSWCDGSTCRSRTSMLIASRRTTGSNPPTTPRGNAKPVHTLREIPGQPADA